MSRYLIDTGLDQAMARGAALGLQERQHDSSLLLGLAHLQQQQTVAKWLNQYRNANLDERTRYHDAETEDRGRGLDLRDKEYGLSRDKFSAAQAKDQQDAGALRSMLTGGGGGDGGGAAQYPPDFVGPPATAAGGAGTEDQAGGGMNLPEGLSSRTLRGFANMHLAEQVKEQQGSAKLQRSLATIEAMPASDKAKTRMRAEAMRRYAGVTQEPYDPEQHFQDMIDSGVDEATAHKAVQVSAGAGHRLPAADLAKMIDPSLRGKVGVTPEQIDQAVALFPENQQDQARRIITARNAGMPSHAAESLGGVAGSNPFQKVTDYLLLSPIKRAEHDMDALSTAYAHETKADRRSVIREEMLKAANRLSQMRSTASQRTAAPAASAPAATPNVAAPGQTSTAPPATAPSLATPAASPAGGADPRESVYSMAADRFRENHQGREPGPDDLQEMRALMQSYMGGQPR